MREIFRALLLLSCFAMVMAARAQDRELKDSEKKAYKADATYAEIAEDPDRFLKKDLSKRCFKVISKGFLTKLPAPHDKILTKPIYVMKIENMQKDVPLLFNSKNERLRKAICDLENDQIVTVYATVVFKSERDDSIPKTSPAKYLKCHFLHVDDIETSSTVKDPSKKDKDSDAPESSEIEDVKYRYVDIQPSKRSGKNVRMEMKFKDISNTIHPQICKFTEISNDEYFVVLPMETFSLPLIVKRDNDNCVKVIAEAEPGAKLSVCGAVQCAKDPSDKNAKPIYYVLVSDISPPGKTN